MRRVTLILAAFWAFLLGAIPIAAKEWRGITPLHSTRADVELLLGRSPDASSSWAIYQTQEEAISVMFASGSPCGSNADNEWRVPRGTVITITVSPKERVLLSSLNIDESKYEKLRDPHKLNRIEYRNKEEGESISVVDDEVSNFTFFAAARDSALHCPGSRAESDSSRAHYFKLDQYGDLSLEDEKIRLDNFAIALQQHPGARGYIIAYPAVGVPAPDTLARLNQAKAYLVNIRGIDAKRLTQILGGSSGRFNIELFIVPPGVKEMPSPSPSPN